MSANGKFDSLKARTPRKIEGDHFKPAAVLVPIQEREDGDYLVLTQRAENLYSHSGQVAFPGGGVEPEDAGPLDAALRESQEEVGIDPRHVRIVGQLDQVTAGYNYLVTPVVGTIPSPYEFHLDLTETAAVFTVPIAALLDHNNVSLDERLSRYWGPIYHFWHEGWDIWGATARITLQLLEVVYEFKGRPIPY
jgi:8-oxo-dGTP pyrophosphatase MutT (NUDIX family)